VIYLIQLKVVFSLQRQPKFLTSQFNPPFWLFNHFKTNRSRHEDEMR